MSLAIGDTDRVEIGEGEVAKGALVEFVSERPLSCHIAILGTNPFFHFLRAIVHLDGKILVIMELAKARAEDSLVRHKEPHIAIDDNHAYPLCCIIRNSTIIKQLPKARQDSGGNEPLFESAHKCDKKLWNIFRGRAKLDDTDGLLKGLHESGALCRLNDRLFDLGPLRFAGVFDGLQSALGRIGDRVSLRIALDASDPMRFEMKFNQRSACWA